MTGVSFISLKVHIFSFSKKSCKWVSLGVIPRPRTLKETLIYSLTTISSARCITN